MKALAHDTCLTGVDLRVPLLLCARLDYASYRRIAQTEIAQALGKRAEHITRSIRKLEERKIIVPGPCVGRSLVWRLNPEYGKPSSIFSSLRIALQGVEEGFRLLSYPQPAFAAVWQFLAV